MSRKVSAARERASLAREKGDYRALVRAYAELEELEPSDGDWPKRAADCHRRLGEDEKRLWALQRAADRYGRSGFVLKAVAVCKLILSIDPNHTQTQQQLAELHGRRRMGIDRVGAGRRAFTTPATAPDIPKAPSAPTLEAPPPSPAHHSAPLHDTPERDIAAAALAQPQISQEEIAIRSPSSRPSIPPGEPLERVSLHEMVPGSARVDDGEAGAVYEIPLDEIEIIVDIDGPEAEPESSVETAAKELLPQVPLFSELEEQSLASLITKVELMEAPKGSKVYEKGDRADCLFVIASGQVSLIAPGPPRVELGRLEEGEFFGIMGLLSDELRASNALVTEDSELLVITRQVLSELVDAHPTVLMAFLRFVRERLVQRLVLTSPLFAPFAGGERRALASRFHFLEVEAGSPLIEQEQKAAGLFVLLSGRADVTRVGGEGERELAQLGAGDVFGEMSLLSNQPAFGTVRMRTGGYALRLDSKDFRELIMTHPQVLIFVGELADERKRQNAAVVAGEEQYEEVSLGDLL